MSSTYKNGRGFTLLDIVIGLAIIGILASIAFSFYDLRVKKTRESEAVHALGTIYTAQQAYKVDPITGAGEFANSIEALGWHLAEAAGTTGQPPASYEYSTNGIIGKAYSPNKDYIVHQTITVDLQNGDITRHE